MRPAAKIMKIWAALKPATGRLDEPEQDSVPVRLTAAKLENRWTFCFAFLPLTPDKDVTVTVSAAGDVDVGGGI